MDRTRIHRDSGLALLLLVLCCAGPAAAAPSSNETAWRSARAALERRAYEDADRLVAEVLSRTTTRDSWYWELRVLRGETLCLVRRPADALKALDFELPAGQRKSRVPVMQRVHTAMALAATGDSKRAASLLARARSEAEQYPDAQPEVYLWSDYFESATNPVKADEFARRALKAAQRHGDRYVEIVALNRIGWFCADRERYGEAVYWFEALLTLATQRRLDYWIQKASGNLGWMYVELGDYETAAELMESAQATARRIDARHDLVVWTNQRGNLALQTGDYAAAEKYCGEAVALSESAKSAALGHALANLARVSIEMNRLPQAQAYNDRALEVKKSFNDADGVQRSLILDAEIASLRGRHDEAIAKLTEIAKSKSDASVRWEAQGRLAQVLLRARREADAEREFRAAIATVREARKSLGDRELRLAFFRVAEDVFDGYVDFLVARKRAEDALAVTESIRAATLEEELGIDAPTNLDPRALARKHRATILCYWLGRAKSYVWVITPASVTSQELGRDRDIEKAIDAYQRQVLDTRLPVQRSRAAGEALYRMLVAPAAPALPINARVIVVPDGRLNVLNMESLVVPGSGTQPRYWIQDVTIVNARSLQLLARPAAPRAARGMLLIGNPRQADAAYPPLAKAKNEIDRVVPYFREKVVLDGARATPAAYREAKPGAFEYLHFVAHGEATRRKPLDAAVILAKDASGSYKLFARDIVTHPLQARLVTVSSCYGAGTRPFVGEGLVGLAWAFLRAGAKQVVAALWEVSDQAAPRLMDAMYANIRAGKDPAAALREAKLQLIRAGGKPFYWAPFVVYGE